MGIPRGQLFDLNNDRFTICYSSSTSPELMSKFKVVNGIKNQGDYTQIQKYNISLELLNCVLLFFSRIGSLNIVAALI